MVRLLFGFQGRINRAQYWTGLLLSSFAFGILLVLMVILTAGGVNFKDPKALGASFGGLTLGLVALFFVAAWNGLALQVKRFHDRGRSGWAAATPLAMGGVVGFIGAIAPFALLGLAPIILLALFAVGLWFFVELGCLPGTQGPNQFGDPPGAGGGMPASPSPRAPFDNKPQAASSLQTAEAAMERAIAERDRQPATPRKTTAPAAAMAPRPSLIPAPASFGRRTTR